MSDNLIELADADSKTDANNKPSNREDPLAKSLARLEVKIDDIKSLLDDLYERLEEVVYASGID